MPELGAALRRFVFERASGLCEYCLLHDSDSFTPHQIDHVISRKHGGSSSPDNLALACIQCNGWKGSDIASIGGTPDVIVPLFNPRTQHWNDHFRFEDGRVVPRTDTGAATVRLLRLNAFSRLAERRSLAAVRSSRSFRIAAQE